MFNYHCTNLHYSVGMRLELVLNEEERGERFKVFNEKKKREDDSAFDNDGKEIAEQESFRGRMIRDTSSLELINYEKQKLRNQLQSTFDNHVTVQFGTISSISRTSKYVGTITATKSPALNMVPSQLHHSEMCNSSLCAVVCS